jgi:glucose-1-phosphate cytidylyltransferase
MKVVLFCGGFGMRLREHSEAIPKPMVEIGNRPIMWHVMKYYAHYGHTDFILCLGWQANVIKDHFLNRMECLPGGCDAAAGGESIKLVSKDTEDWNITFVDTGIDTNIGQRLRAVRQHLAGEENFLANYTDGLSDLPLPEMIDFHDKSKPVATFLSVRPTHSFHTVSANADGAVTEITAISDSDVWMNAGYFVLNKRIFDFIKDGDELVDNPFQRLVAREELSTFRYEGFFACMDTYKEMQILQSMYAQGNSHWEVWNHGPDAIKVPSIDAGSHPGAIQPDSSVARIPR